MRQRQYETTVTCGGTNGRRNLGRCIALRWPLLNWRHRLDAHLIEFVIWVREPVNFLVMFFEGATHVAAMTTQVTIVGSCTWMGINCAPKKKIMKKQEKKDKKNDKTYGVSSSCSRIWRPIHKFDSCEAECPCGPALRDYLILWPTPACCKLSTSCTPLTSHGPIGRGARGLSVILNSIWNRFGFEFDLNSIRFEFNMDLNWI